MKQTVLQIGDLTIQRYRTTEHPANKSTWPTLQFPGRYDFMCGYCGKEVGDEEPVFVLTVETPSDLKRLVGYRLQIELLDGRIAVGMCIHEFPVPKRKKPSHWQAIFKLCSESCAESLRNDLRAMGDIYFGEEGT